MSFTARPIKMHEPKGEAIRLLAKAEKVLESCQNYEQLMSAKRYAKLALARVEEIDALAVLHIRPESIFFLFLSPQLQDIIRDVKVTLDTERF